MHRYFDDHNLTGDYFTARRSRRSGKIEFKQSVYDRKRALLVEMSSKQFTYDAIMTSVIKISEFVTSTMQCKDEQCSLYIVYKS